MIWKTIFVAFFAVGVLGDYLDMQRQQIKSALGQMCKKNHAEENLESVEAAAMNYVDCIKDQIDVDSLRREIEETLPSNVVVFMLKKYCAKAAEMKVCHHGLMTGVMPCTDASFREHISTINNATDQFIDFFCYNNGDRIALFVTQGGFECIQEKSNEIQQCAVKAWEGVNTAEDAQKLTLEQRCSRLSELSTCALKALKACRSPIPGDLTESLYQLVIDNSPCKK